ncbi:hypothetical protein MTO96_001123 [Rhipicephalus appendiculatus]
MATAAAALSLRLRRAAAGETEQGLRLGGRGQCGVRAMRGEWVLLQLPGLSALDGRSPQAAEGEHARPEPADP